MLERECLRILSLDEMEKWKGLVNYVSHHGVDKPASGSTPLRIVANSSLDNNWSGNSYNSCLIKGPNAPTPLLEVLYTFRFLEFIVVWDIHKAYNGVFIALARVHFGDRPAGLALQLAKDYARKEGAHICT